MVAVGEIACGRSRRGYRQEVGKAICPRRRRREQHHEQHSRRPFIESF